MSYMAGQVILTPVACDSMSAQVGRTIKSKFFCKTDLQKGNTLTLAGTYMLAAVKVTAFNTSSLPSGEPMGSVSYKRQLSSAKLPSIIVCGCNPYCYTPVLNLSPRGSSPWDNCCLCTAAPEGFSCTLVKARQPLPVVTA